MFFNLIFLLLWSFLRCKFFKVFSFIMSFQFLDSISSEVGTIEKIPTFGHQPVVLGGFYSAVKNQFIPGLSILPSQQIKDNINVIHHPIQKTLWTNHLKFYERLELLNIDIGGSVTVDLEAGKKLTAGGSFQYLDVDEVCLHCLFKLY